MRRAAMNPADFAALRAALLVRMGEGEAARAVVQDVDTGNFTPGLTQAALDAYVATADFTGVCPAVALQGTSRKDPQWQSLQAICAAFRGEGDAARWASSTGSWRRGAMPKIDVLLAQKYAGAAGKARRAVKIEWDGVTEMTPWRYALTIGVGLQPPEALMRKAGARYDYMAATAPMLGLTARAAAADRAGAAGVLSSAAMVDLYSQIYADQDTTGDWETRADQLRDAYVGADARGPADRDAAAVERGGRCAAALFARGAHGLCRRADARSNDLAGDAPDLIASMLTAGLDANAMRWAPFAEIGSQAWALLALAAPARARRSPLDALESSRTTTTARKRARSGFLLAGLAGTGPACDPDGCADFATSAKFDIDRARRAGRGRSTVPPRSTTSGLVALLAGLGMQGDGWAKMTPLYLYHIVSALRRVGLEAEARMIAAEAVARG